MRVHNWHTKCWQIYPSLSNWKFQRFHLWLLIFHSSSESSTFGRPWSWHIYPSFKRQFHRFLLWLLIFLSYSESSTFGRPDLRQVYPSLKWLVSQISCSDCSYFFPTLRAQHLADEVLTDLPPIQMAISQIPALLWEFVFGRPSVEQIYPSLPNGNFTDSCFECSYFISYSESSTFGRLGSWHIYPLSNGNFTDSCSDCSYFLPTLRAQHLADQVLADLSHLSNGNFTNSCSDYS